MSPLRCHQLSCYLHLFASAFPSSKRQCCDCRQHGARDGSSRARRRRPAGAGPPVVSLGRRRRVRSHAGRVRRPRRVRRPGRRRDGNRHVARRSRHLHTRRRGDPLSPEGHHKCSRMPHGRHDVGLRRHVRRIQRDVGGQVDGERGRRGLLDAAARDAARSQMRHQRSAVGAAQRVQSRLVVVRGLGRRRVDVERHLRRVERK